MESGLPKPIADAFVPLIGRPAWGVHQGYGSFLTLEFGEPRLEISEPTKLRSQRLVTVRGEWHLWIYCCGWDITQDGDRLANHEAEESSIRQATAQLDGQCLERLWLEPGTVVTHFEFDLGANLTTYPYDSDAEINEQWLLFEPSGNVLTVRTDNRFCYQPGDTPPDEEQWLPLLSVYET
jgi:hypothetical protein